MQLVVRGAIVGSLAILVMAGCAEPASERFEYRLPHVMVPPKAKPPVRSPRPESVVRFQPTPMSAPRPVIERFTPEPVVNTNWMPIDGRISGRWSAIVLHHSATTAGGAARFDQFHRVNRGWDELGYHFVIGNGTDTGDGTVEVGSRWLKQKHGAHCRTPGNFYNEHGIGICLVGNFQNQRPTPAQLDSLRRLLTFLMIETGISRDQIYTHGGVTNKTACPGRLFPGPATLVGRASYAAAGF